MTKSEIEKASHDEVYARYKELKRNCRTVAQEVHLITSDPETIMIRERLLHYNEDKQR